MITSRLTVLSVACVLLWATSISAQDMSRYRQYQFGMATAAAAAQAGVPLAGVRTLHRRPALIEELEWQPIPLFGAPAGQGEPVRTIRFTFYEGKLFRIAVWYERDRTVGLTTADIVEAMSVQYGPPTLATTPIGLPVLPDKVDSNLGYDMTLAAHWEDATYSINLVRSSFAFGFGLVLWSKEADASARAATAEAERLDLRDAPQREIDRLKKQGETDRAAQEKARAANRLAFRY